jgi:hypothetical protein
LNGIEESLYNDLKNIKLLGLEANPKTSPRGGDIDWRPRISRFALTARHFPRCSPFEIIVNKSIHRLAALLTTGWNRARLVSPSTITIAVQ